MPDDKDATIQQLRNELAHERRTHEFTKANYKDLLNTMSDLNRRLAALDDAMIGSGDDMRYRPDKREEYKLAVRRLVEFWRAAHK